MKAQLQMKKAGEPEIKKQNLTGIPTQMKLDFERRSGLSFDDIQVHYNSDKPARLGALAYTQGNQVYMGPGQERHLPHELGHVIQQKTGRVRPTRWIAGLPVNDQPELEREADLAPAQCMPAPDQQDVVQMYTEEEVSKVMERFAARRWYEISESNCRELLEEADEGYTPRIGNHFAVLRRLSNGVLRIEKKKFSGVGTMGRLVDQGGAECEIIDLDDNFPDYEDIPVSFQGSISLNSLPSTDKRQSLAQVMGGSAATLSEIVNAEYLHIIGHQLGGQDEAGNLMAGLHALNTAMIPLENLVADLLSCNIEVEYEVKMLPRPGFLVWASDAQITISASKGGQTYSRSLMIRITNNPTEYLSKQDYDKIEEYANQFRKEIGLL